MNGLCGWVIPWSIKKGKLFVRVSTFLQTIANYQPFSMIRNGELLRSVQERIRSNDENPCLCLNLLRSQVLSSCRVKPGMFRHRICTSSEQHYALPLILNVRRHDSGGRNARWPVQFYVAVWISGTSSVNCFYSLQFHSGKSTRPLISSMQNYWSPNLY